MSKLLLLEWNSIPAIQTGRKIIINLLAGVDYMRI
jgi:hypothetical protein